MRAERARPPSISRRWKNVFRNESENSLMTFTTAVTANVATSTTKCGTVTLETLIMKESQSNSNTTEFVAALILFPMNQSNGRSGTKVPSLLACSLLAPCLVVPRSLRSLRGAFSARGKSPRFVGFGGLLRAW